MKVKLINGQSYKLPNSLSTFQEEMYVHLINWKWKRITKASGLYNYKGQIIEYDAILPKSVQNNFPLVYPQVLGEFKKHNEKYGFKFHQHFNHMASSQAANLNLFLPLLLHSKVNEIFNSLKPDFKRLAPSELYKGFRIEFWDGNTSKDRGLLKDHSSQSGTDSDIGIAYYNNNEELCLWLIEHKLTEKEFTECGGYKSEGRDKSKHLCEKNFSEILADKKLCYHHDIKGREYWNLTDYRKSFFVNHSKQPNCPFKGGLNQLWRNQLLGFALEKAGLFKKVYFSVVKHPQNDLLNESINKYQELINHNNRFSVFSSKKVIDAAIVFADPVLNKWIIWYKDLYKITD